MAFSSALTLADLSDYLAPSQLCIKPITFVEDTTPAPELPVLKNPAIATTEIVIDAEHGYYEITKEGEQTGKKLKKAEITLNDCLACSGCITSAESVLVSMQSHEEVYRVLEEQPDLTPILSIAPQSLASLAALHDLTSEQAMKGLRVFFKQVFGFRLVFDTTFARSLSLAENRREFLERKANSLSPSRSTPTTSPPIPTLPILSSACPGWICYAEKTHGELLPFVSAVKSSQGIMGTLVKAGEVAKSLGLSPERIYHVTVMPCYDKKLEASRPDFTTSLPTPDSPSATFDTPTPTTIDVRDVDCVLTTGEVQRMLDDKGLDLAVLALSSPSSFSTSTPSINAVGIPNVSNGAEQIDTTGEEEARFFPSLLSVPGTSSGGYLHNTIQAVLEGLSVDELYETKLVEKKMRSEDYIEFTLVASTPAPSSSSVVLDGEMEIERVQEERTLLRAAKCYGFRNLQNVVRKIGRDAGVTVNRGAAGVLPPSSSASSAASSATARRNAATALRRKKAGNLEEESRFDYVEVMACPSGCVNGGGQIAPPKYAIKRRNGKGRAIEGRLDAEGMPAMDEIMVDVEDAEGRVLSGKEWVARVEKVYWEIGSELAPPPSTRRTIDWSRIDESIAPYLSDLQTEEMESIIERILEGMTRGGNIEERRKELLRTEYRAVVDTEVNGLAVKW